MALLQCCLKPLGWRMQLVKGAESRLPKSLIKLNTLTIAVVGATSASSEISQAWNIPGQKGQNWEKIIIF